MRGRSNRKNTTIAKPVVVFFCNDNCLILRNRDMVPGIHGRICNCVYIDRSVDQAVGIQGIGQFVHYGQRLGPVVSVHRIGDIHGDQQIGLHFALTGGFLNLTNQITADIGADGRGKIGKIGFQKGFPLRIHCRREGQGEYWKNHQDFGEPADQEGKSQHDKQHAEEENTEKVFASFQTVGIDSGAQYQQIHSICRQSDCGSGGNRF